MGNVTIPMLPQAIGLTGAEQLEAVQAGTSVRVTAAQIANLGNGGASPTTVGEFVGTLTGFATSPTGTCFYTTVGTAVILYVPAMTGVSNAPTMTLTGLPAAIQPLTAKTVLIPSIDNASVNNALGSATINGAVITFALYTNTPPIQNTGGFASTGTKGINIGAVIVYDLN
jgi:hypothetical protein